MSLFSSIFRAIQLISRFIIAKIYIADAKSTAIVDTKFEYSFTLSSLYKKTSPFYADFYYDCRVCHYVEIVKNRAYTRHMLLRSRLYTKEVGRLYLLKDNKGLFGTRRGRAFGY